MQRSVQRHCLPLLPRVHRGNHASPGPCHNPPLPVAQVWRNCTMYNQPGNAVRIMGDMLSDIWERAWLDSNVEGCWADVLRRYPLVSGASFVVSQW